MKRIRGLHVTVPSGKSVQDWHFHEHCCGTVMVGRGVVMALFCRGTVFEGWRGKKLRTVKSESWRVLEKRWR